MLIRAANDPSQIPALETREVANPKKQIAEDGSLRWLMLMNSIIHDSAITNTVHSVAYGCIVYLLSFSSFCNNLH